jgi:hypothetical protein
MRVSRLVALSATALSAFSAVAEETYVGIDVRWNNVMLQNASNSGTYTNSANNTTTLKTDSNSSIYPTNYWGYGILLGHMFTSHVGVETGFYQYFNASNSVSASTEASSSPNYGAGTKVNVAGKGLFVDILGALRPMSMVSLFGTLGAAVEDRVSGSKISANNATQYDHLPTSTAFDSVVLNIGVGAMYHATKDLAVKLQVKYGLAFVQGSTGQLTVGLGLNYRVD